MSTSARRVDVIGAPFNSAGLADGVARAPQALRRAGVVRSLAEAGLAVTDRGDVELPPPTPERNADSHVIATAALAPMIGAVQRTVTEALAAGATPLVLGGDCPVLIGCLAATAALDRPRVLFVDGHEDAWPPERSTTGEAADMELGWLLDRTTATLPAELRREIPTMAPQDVIVLGARDEQELADADVASIGDVVRIVRPGAIVRDPAGVVENAVSTLRARGPWWLHVDLDVLATDSLAAVDYRQPGGLDWATLTELTGRALTSPGVVGWSVTIYNPDLDADGAAARRIVRYVAEVSGRSSFAAI